MAVEKPDAASQFFELSTEDLCTACHKTSGFDGVFSNFSGLNCVHDHGKCCTAAWGAGWSRAHLCCFACQPAFVFGKLPTTCCAQTAQGFAPLQADLRRPAWAILTSGLIIQRFQNCARHFAPMVPLASRWRVSASLYLLLILESWIAEHPQLLASLERSIQSCGHGRVYVLSAITCCCTWRGCRDANVAQSTKRRSCLATSMALVLQCPRCRGAWN